MSRENAIEEVKKALGEGGIELADEKAGAVADALNEKGMLTVEELDQISGGFKWSGLTDGQKKVIKIGGAAMGALAVGGTGALAWYKKDKIADWAGYKPATHKEGGFLGFGAKEVRDGPLKYTKKK